MPDDLILPLIMRWLHIFSAIVAVGGTMFIYFVLRPAAAATLPEPEHAALREAVRKRWQHFIHAAILLFLVSGLYNYLVVTRLLHEGQPLYHALFGVKFLLALAVFVLGLALTSGKAWSARLRANPGTWLGLLVLLAVVIVMISGFLRAMPRTSPATVAVETANLE